MWFALVLANHKKSQETTQKITRNRKKSQQNTNNKQTTKFLLLFREKNNVKPFSNQQLLHGVKSTPDASRAKKNFNMGFSHLHGAKSTPAGSRATKKNFNMGSNPKD
jgi:hypothetical protein